MYRQNSVLAALGRHTLELKAHLTPISLRAGQILAEPERKFDRIYFLASGLVSARIPFESGDEVECVLAGRNAAIGGVVALGVDAPVTRAVCLFDAPAWAMSVGTLRAAMARSPVIEQTIKACCMMHMSFSALVGACNAMHAAEKRLARWLVLANDLMRGAALPLRQEELGIMLGVQRSVVSPALQRFQADGLINLGRSRITVLDAPGLCDRACGCHRTMGRLVWPERRLQQLAS